MKLYVEIDRKELFNLFQTENYSCNRERNTHNIYTPLKQGSKSESSEESKWYKGLRMWLPNQ